MAQIERSKAEKVARLSSGNRTVVIATEDDSSPMFELEIHYEKDGSKKTTIKWFGEEF